MRVRAYLPVWAWPLLALPVVAGVGLWTYRTVAAALRAQLERVDAYYGPAETRGPLEALEGPPERSRAATVTYRNVTSRTHATGASSPLFPACARISTDHAAASRLDLGS
jgi:hypothetical protein